MVGYGGKERASGARPGCGPSFTIRRAERRDAVSLAALATQLGYPSSTEQVEKRLESVRQDPDHAVYVAVWEGRVVAWLHALVSRVLESDPSVQIGGLVVEESLRGNGAGRLLMQYAERWARQKRCRTVSLRTNIIRKEAHRFYEKLGYALVKTQHAFQKKLYDGTSITGCSGGALKSRSGTWR
jgi:GNAT superfamily N-acetyltransferase